MINRTLVNFVCVLLTMAATAYANGKANFIVIMTDDMGYSDLSCYGNDRYKTPHIDKLRAQGVKFNFAYAACAVCSPTRASIITGQYPARTGCTNWGGSVRGTEIGLPAVLRDAGYRTFFAGKWHIGNLTPKQAGFATEKPMGTKGPADDPKSTRAIATATIEFIKAAPDKPFFTSVSYHAVHSQAKERGEVVAKYREKWAAMPKPEGPAFAPEHGRKNKLIQNNARFAAMLEVVDDSVRNILKAVDEIGATDNTVVFFFSDNGGLSTKPYTSNVPLRAGKGWYYEGGIRVPLIVKWPGVVQAGSTCDVPVISNDFYPTILEIVGLPLRPKDHVDALSLAGLLKTGKAPDRDAFYWHYPHHHGAGCPPCSAVRSGEIKLIHYYEDDTLEMYNVKEDVSETTNLVETMPDKTKELKAKLNKWLTEIGAKLPKPFDQVQVRRIRRQVQQFDLQ